jgi:hypothetical protein
MSKNLPPPPAPIEPPTLPPSLQTRIDQLHADIETYIDSVVAKDAGCGIPTVRLKHDLMTRAGWCHCAAVSQHPER